MGHYMSLINRRARSFFTAELAPFSLGPGQQAYLLALQPGETVTQETIAHRLQVDKANVTRAIKKMETEGYLERRKSLQDQRAVLVTLTPEGRAVRSAVEDISRRWVAKLKTAVQPEEWDALEKTLQTLAESLSAPSR